MLYKWFSVVYIDSYESVTDYKLFNSGDCKKMWNLE